MTRTQFGVLPKQNIKIRTTPSSMALISEKKQMRPTLRDMVGTLLGLMAAMQNHTHLSRA
jgi:hypothetical protein